MGPSYEKKAAMNKGRNVMKYLPLTPYHINNRRHKLRNIVRDYVINRDNVDHCYVTICRSFCIVFEAQPNMPPSSYNVIHGSLWYYKSSGTIVWFVCHENR